MITFRSNLGKGENGEYFAVHYDSCNNIDADKAKRAQDLLEKFFTRIKSHKNMARNVRILRGIFRDYDERSLEIEYKDDRRSEHVWFKDGNLSQFKLSKLTDGEWKEIISLNCEPGEIEAFTMEQPGWKKIDYSKLEPIDPDLNSDLEEYEETAELYKLFYGETLDFTDPNANVRIQAMALI